MKKSKPSASSKPVAKPAASVVKKIVKPPAPVPTKKSASAPPTTKPSSSKSLIAVWQNDPESGLKPSKRPAPALSVGLLPLQIEGTAPKAGLFNPGTPHFRYWNCADAIQRAKNVWHPCLPETLQWQTGTGNPLEVVLNGHEDLNAFYDRKTLTFHHATIKGKTVHTADSPDVVAHEMGHAILDALRPDLWDAALDEVAAFHESFADLTALLSALQNETIAAAVLKETGGMLYSNSIVSRFAVQFGKSVHAVNPASAPADCLRNAVNSFFYREPMFLPPMAPHYELSSEPHSFSRLFTAGFFEGMAAMLKAISSKPTPADIVKVSVDAAALLGRAVQCAALTAAFYSEMAAQVIWADATLFEGKFEEAFRSAFVRRGLLSLEGARSLKAEAVRVFATGKPNAGGDDIPRGRDIILRASAYGLMEGALVVRTASFSRRGLIAPAAPDTGSTPVPGVEQATQSFLETLFRRGRIDFSQCKPGLSSVPHTGIKRKTHYLIEQNGQYHLRRRCFDEGIDW
ncbi:hypothetical protein FEM03_18530 [Phragmitibacter flavus]|uniref:Peptidase M4 domain-containing protein n=1 Tax=Phragmitibacter flavus TaxID=2576071 RepID=A0A5R8KBQ8_9BACT|nr:hypothetical protein [Phragmitibacter flavus]TLD69365.1 hypothetical protein FEM03_18530 [Phragmitibacter flavus]